MLGQRTVFDPDFSYNIPLEVFHTAISRLGKVVEIIPLSFKLDEEQRESLYGLIPDGYTQEQQNDLVRRLISKEFIVVAEKN